MVRVDTGEELWSAEGRLIQALSFSPQSTYLLSWERMKKEDPAAPAPPTEDGANGGAKKTVKGNLVAWRAMTGEALGGFTQKNFRKPDWPTVQWTRDEALCFKVYI